MQSEVAKLFLGDNICGTKFTTGRRRVRGANDVTLVDWIFDHFPLDR